MAASNWVTGGPNVSEPITIINSFYSPESEDFAQVIVGVDYTYRAHSKLNDFLSDAVSSYSMYPEYFPAFKLDYSSTDNATLAGERAYMLEGRYNDSELGIQKVMDIGTIIGNRGYFVQYIASPSMYSHYLPTVQTMLDSVQIIPSETISEADPQTQDQETSSAPLQQEIIPSESQGTTGYLLTVIVTDHPFGTSAVDIDILTENGYRDSKKVSTAGGASATFDIPSSQGNSVRVCVDAGLLHFEQCQGFIGDGNNITVEISADDTS